METLNTEIVSDGTRYEVRINGEKFLSYMDINEASLVAEAVEQYHKTQSLYQKVEDE